MTSNNSQASMIAARIDLRHCLAILDLEIESPHVITLKEQAISIRNTYLKKALRNLGVNH